MKSTLTNLAKFASVFVLVFIANASMGANYYAYKSKQVTINGGGTFTEYKWILVTQPNGTTNAVIAGQTTSALTQTFTDEGQYKLRLQVKNADGCWSDVDTNTDIDIFVLPDFTVTVAPDGLIPASYCTNADAANRTSLKATATITGAVTLPSDVTIALADWYKTPSTGDITALTAVATGTNPYLLTETTVGSHYYVATGKYNIPTGRLISAANAAVKSTATTITINAAPTTPTITPVAVN